MFPVLALMVEFCVGIVTVDALELARVFFSGKKFHETLWIPKSNFPGCPSGDCGGVSSGTGMADVGRIQFVLFPANACMKTMLGFGLELQVCVSRKCL